MKFWSLIIFLFLILIWALVSFGFLGFQKPNTYKVDTTSTNFTTPTPELRLTETATPSATPQISKALDSTGSSFIVGSPSISVLQY